MNEHRTHLNNMLRGARELTGLDQAAFADVYRIALRTVQRAETDRRPPGKATLRRYAMWEQRGPKRAGGGMWPALGLSMEQLLQERRKATEAAYRARDPEPPDPEIEEAIEEAANAFRDALRKLAGKRTRRGGTFVASTLVAAFLGVGTPCDQSHGEHVCKHDNRIGAVDE